MSEHDKPVAWMSWNDRDGVGFWQDENEARLNCDVDYDPQPLYTRPAQWVGLTDEDVSLLDWESFKSKKECVQAIEALLRERNT